ncbi:hypothetical protein GQ53DRAFT_114076 [Thozetella sp. PMI_491]|nr:hypothetical protein GQ53DRAFT_114076 [Thozetella sp. PMI_491]
MPVSHVAKLGPWRCMTSTLIDTALAIAVTPLTHQASSYTHSFQGSQQIRYTAYCLSNSPARLLAGPSATLLSRLQADIAFARDTADRPRLQHDTVSYLDDMESHVTDKLGLIRLVDWLRYGGIVLLASSQLYRIRPCQWKTRKETMTFSLETCGRKSGFISHGDDVIAPN